MCVIQQVVKGASDDPGGSNVNTVAVQVDSGSFAEPRILFLLQEIGLHGQLQSIFPQREIIL